MLEVECKFSIDDPSSFESEVRSRGGVWSAPATQIDTYYSHPLRDFAHTDEALRIRVLAGESFITYKGPRVDSQTKTRRELELPLSDGPRFAELLSLLGFQPVVAVRKRRRVAELTVRGRAIEICSDEVDEVGRFVELETLAEERELDDARAAVLSLAAELGLVGGECRSYLALLLAARARRGDQSTESDATC